MILVNAARAANVERFLFVSFRPWDSIMPTPPRASTDPEPAPSVGFLSAMSPGSAPSPFDTPRPAVSSGGALMLGYLRAVLGNAAA